jgi:hypothetical protein
MATTKTTSTTTRKPREPEPAETPQGPTGLAEVRKPLLASVGVAELAVEKLREIPGYAGEVKKITGLVNGIQTQVREFPTAARGTVRALPTQVQSGLTELSEKAKVLYGDLADRGEKRVAVIRRSPATKEAVARTKTAVSQTRAARTSTRRAADAVGKAAANAASPGAGA